MVAARRCATSTGAARCRSPGSLNQAAAASDAVPRASLARRRSGHQAPGEPRFGRRSSKRTSVVAARSSRRFDAGCDALRRVDSVDAVGQGDDVELAVVVLAEARHRRLPRVRSRPRAHAVAVRCRSATMVPSQLSAEEVRAVEVGMLLPAVHVAAGDRARTRRRASTRTPASTASGAVRSPEYAWSPSSRFQPKLTPLPASGRSSRRGRSPRTRSGRRRRSRGRRSRGRTRTATGCAARTTRSRGSAPVASTNGLSAGTVYAPVAVGRSGRCAGSCRAACRATARCRPAWPCGSPRAAAVAEPDVQQPSGPNASCPPLWFGLRLLDAQDRPAASTRSARPPLHRVLVDLGVAVGVGVVRRRGASRRARTSMPRRPARRRPGSPSAEVETGVGRQLAVARTTRMTPSCSATYSVRVPGRAPGDRRSRPLTTVSGSSLGEAAAPRARRGRRRPSAPSDESGSRRRDRAASSSSRRTRERDATAIAAR